MQMQGKSLNFISRILRDGSGVGEVSEDYKNMLQEEMFEINCLSLTQRTFIASGFNSFVVSLKNDKLA